jgi:hypothetical protein
MKKTHTLFCLIVEPRTANNRGIPAPRKIGYWNREGGYCGGRGRGRSERGSKTWAEQAQEGAEQQSILDNAAACEAATISNKTKLLKSTDQEQLRNLALVLEATTTAHDSRTAMLTCAGNLELQLWYCVEYLAVENGFRVEDLSCQASASCVQQSSQPIHTQVLLRSWWDKGRRIAHPMRPRPNLGPRACCIFAVNFGDFVHHPSRIIFVPCNPCICYSPTRDSTPPNLQE